MKHLKVKDLDLVLQDCISEALRKISLLITNYDSTPVSELFEYVDWSTCTNEERLKYAELMYCWGVCYFNAKPEHSMLCYRSTGLFFITHDNSIVRSSFHNGCVYCAISNRWGKIYSRPEDREETKEPEFKPGEIIDEYRNGEVYQPVIYRFFADGVHWVSKARADKAVFIPDEIRKIQPDPEKEIALAAVNYCDQMDEFYKGRDRDIQIAITAIRKYKALKTEVK